MSDIEKSPIDSRMGSLSAAGSSTIASGTTLLKAEVDPENGHKNNKQGENARPTPGITLMLFSFDLPSALDLEKDCPPGYSQVATFQCSDPNFLQYRGFKYLHSRLLSHMQYEIQELEDELDGLDDWDRIHNDQEKRLICLENDMLYKRCDQFPEEFQLDFERTRPEVFAELRRRECAGFDGFVERMLHLLDAGLCRLHCPIIRKLFITQELREKTTDTSLQYYAPARVDKLVGFIITGVIFMLLVLPVVALYELSNVGRRESPFEAIGILIIFTLLFAAAMSALTKATRQELFAASAAYCAVLVVFISNFGTQAVTLV
ncbi:hypothetical protein KC343_g6537 [Hortaea werneckii]|nr:hypothetical protein KC352_g15220 [Hortaea werneckii]KAI7563527.1 hypothetical protein KC317_g7671 [Hortaea werneckii]KAI7613166.1 hypothetical protein KC346_g7459 [Hortaea werneckii]KAI7625736.1 hypothetical protein KC343_g6537 [Hortaea werneckii]KAI7656483.1 hypothetical protein KC319_g9736 [Hortaea werneckii]